MTSVVETKIRSVVTKGIGLVARINRGRINVDRPHPFLGELHEPMTEELTLEDLPVTGTIPAELNGRYLRIGPNPAAPDPAGYHWFMGDGMVHGIALSGSRAKWYRNRWIRSHPVEKATGLPTASGPRHSGSDTVNTNVAAIGGRTFALIEASSFPVELDETLDGQAYSDFGGTLRGSFTAHPHRDPLTGEQHAITYEGTETGTIHHVVISPEGQVVREEPISVRHGPSVHDSAFTQRYVVILDLPVTFSMRTLIGGHTFPYRWNPDHQARVGLMPRRGRDADVIWVNVDPCYVFHVANAFDLPDGRVVMDLVAYGSMFAGDYDGPNGKNLGLERWTIDPVVGAVER